jgi:DNA-binding CsgD family transcriptional regulator
VGRLDRGGPGAGRHSIAATDALGPRAGAQLAPYVHRAICLTELNRDAAAEHSLEVALRQAERGVGTDYLLWAYQCWARLRFLRGDWDEALAAVHGALDLPDQVDMHRHLRATAVLIAVHRGDHATVAALRPHLLTGPPPTSPGTQSAGTPTWALALAAHLEGNPGEAVRLLRGAWDPHPDADPLRYLRHYLVPDLVAMSVATGDFAGAEQIARGMAAYAAQRSSPSLRRSSRHARALADRDPVALTDIAAEHETAGRTLFAAQAREQAVPLLVTAGDGQRARGALLAALAGYEALDARWDLARAEALLRSLGMRRGVRGPRRRPKTGWDALTPTERTVANLVADGLSNPRIAERMYLSRRTVQGHVSSILGKLGVASRTELAALIARGIPAGR